jgi:paraquat-inducible protein A
MRRVGARRGVLVSASAASLGLLACGTCGLLQRRPAGGAPALACARCGSPVHTRKPDSVMRTWALVIAAYMLYLPANLLPILQTNTLKGSDWDTIMSGLIFLWLDGLWPLSIIIFVASIVIPLAKLLTLSYLLLSVRQAWTPHRRARTRLYRLVDLVGKWSMVDIYVGAMLVGLVQFAPVASVRPGPGAVAFGAVVVLTIFASHSFDPRLLWDAPGPRDAGAEKTRHG